MTEAQELPPTNMLVECPTCEKVVMAAVQSHVITWPYQEPGERWCLITCDEGHPMLTLQNDFGSGFNDDEPLRMYPPSERSLSPQIPEPLRQEHEEARTCFRNKAYSAAVVMSGRVIEGVCAEFGFTRGRLEANLEKMKDAGHIDGRLAEWATLLRQVRNAGAHFDGKKARIDRQDAEDSLAFSEALLDYLYVLKARFEALQQRRNAPGSGS